jgi:hypothetical protein
MADMAEKIRKPSAPAGLGARGRKLWREIVAIYDLRPDDLVILENACRIWDEIERLRVALETAPLLVRGSLGQDRANPLLAEIRQARALQAQLFRRLDLPDVETDENRKPKSAQHQHAARARWANHERNVANRGA